MIYCSLYDIKVAVIVHHDMERREYCYHGQIIFCSLFPANRRRARGRWHARKVQSNWEWYSLCTRFEIDIMQSCRWMWEVEITVIIRFENCQHKNNQVCPQPKVKISDWIWSQIVEIVDLTRVWGGVIKNVWKCEGGTVSQVLYTDVPSKHLLRVSSE